MARQPGAPFFFICGFFIAQSAAVKGLPDSIFGKLRVKR
jgi:hypothetical protein